MMRRQHTLIYAKVGTGPGLHWLADITTVPVKNMVFEIRSTPVVHGEKPMGVRCYDIKDLGAGVTMYLLEAL